MSIRINERSLATAVLARCLRIKGADFVLVDGAETPLTRPSHICINDVAISLLGQFFPGIWRDGTATCRDLEMREVLWGEDAVPRRIRQEAKVIDASALTNRLFAMLDAAGPSGAAAPVTWQVNPGSGGAKLLRTGERAMLTLRVDLARPLDPPRSLVESLMDGWMFLAPIDADSAILQAMIPKPVADTAARLQAMLDQSSLIAPHVTATGPVLQFPAAPAIRLPIAEETGQILIGGRGARLDPVSGEGAPFAIRTAILAAAVLTHDGPVAQAVDLYQRRILTSFLSHLAGCQSFYADAFSGDADWQMELRKSGIARSMLKPAFGDADGSDLPLRLDGLTLVAATSAPANGSTPRRPLQPAHP